MRKEAAQRPSFTCHFQGEREKREGRPSLGGPQMAKNYHTKKIEKEAFYLRPS